MNDIKKINAERWMQKPMNLRWIAMVSMWLVLAGCAGLSGDNGPSDAALSGDPDAMWADGQKAVKKGETLVQKGEDRLNEGRKQIREGEQMLSEGNDKVLRSRQEYQTAASTTGGASTPALVASEAKRLKAIGSNWEDGIDEIKDGNKLIDKGNKALDKGQAEVREGRALLESGSTMMRNSQRIRLGEDLLPVDKRLTLNDQRETSRDDYTR